MAKMKEKFKMNTSKQKAHRLSFWLFPSVKSIHKSMKMWLVILNSKDQGQKKHLSNKIDLGMFCENSLFDSLFLLNLRFSLRIFCVFWKGTTYDYLYCENGVLEWLLDNVRFVPNLNINTKNLHFLCFWNPTCVRRLVLAYACLRLRT